MKMLTLCSLLLGLIMGIPFLVNGQTYTGPGGPIADDGTSSVYQLVITDLTPEGLSTVHGLKEVCIDVTHSWMADLDIRLTAPDGTAILLTATLGGDLDGYVNTCFSMESSQHILDGSYPYTGSFRPFSRLGTVNNGHIGNGTWQLQILDAYPFADAGEVISWSLTFGDTAPAPMEFTSTYLPIVLLTTDDARIIPNDPKINGRIRIIHNDMGLPNQLGDVEVINVNMAIETRGSSSQSFPKKSYGFETQDSEGEDLEISLLGLPKEEDWILYAPYTDKSLVRDALTYQLGRDFGRYAPRTVFCELFLNGDYQGVYCLEEKIKRDKNRVNITKLDEDDVTGDALTGGYIIKVDRDDGDGTYFISEYNGTHDQEVRVVFEDPEGPDLVAEQKAYIEDYYDRFEDALFGDDFADPVKGYRGYIDVGSFVDLFLVSELGHNVDAYRLSTFLYKDRNSVDSLLHAGPLWDFNLAFGNVDYCNCQLTEGWAYENSGACGNTPRWWTRLLEDPAFADDVRCRFDSLRMTLLSTERLHAWIDSMQSTFDPVVARNYDRWPILGRYVWPNFFIGSTYHEEVVYLKQWVADRLTWMDANLPGNTCISSGLADLNSQELHLYPNPADRWIEVHEGSKGLLTFTDINGRQVKQVSFEPGSPRVDMHDLLAGTYMVSLSNGISHAVTKLVVLK